METTCKSIYYSMRIALCLLIFLLTPTVSAQEAEYGLKFYSNNYDPEKRTSLNLSPEDYLSFSDGFSISFDAKFHFKDIHIYGYVFRIINEKGDMIDLVMGSNNMVFTMPSGNIVSNNSRTEAKLTADQWLSIQMTADIENEELEIRVGEFTRKWNIPEIKEFDKVKITFGKTDYMGKTVIDVPDMTIKNLKIAKPDGKLIYSWKLSKHAANGVYDELKHHFAKCENPNWLLDSYGVWKKETEFTTGRSPYLSYDFDKNKLAVADQQSFYLVDIGNRQVEKQDINKTLSYNMSSNQMIYNPLDSNFYAYNLIKEGDAREFVPFDREKGEWGNTTAHNHNTDYRHHNRHFSTKNNCLYLFGGYGHFKYKEEVLVYNVDSAFWTQVKLKGDRIAPRYLAGMGEIDENRLLFFGGYGSETGDQALLAQFYYDCYIVDINTMEAKKVWTMENPTENFVVSNSLVVDTINNCFYALCYPSMQLNSTISLYKFSLEKPVYEIMADPIPIKFNDVSSHIDLFFDKYQNRLVAASFAPKEQAETIVSVHTLSFPPLKNTDIYQYDSEDELSFLLLSIASILALSLFAFLFIRKKKRNTKRNATKNQGKDEEIIPIVGINTVNKLRNQSIYMFGGFQVIDKKGNDVTVEFKPLLKSLFLLILLNTIKNGKGISFAKLKEILWFDKNEESANNNRGVALSKIRQIMDNVGEIQFLKKGTYWMVEFGDEIYCDYYEALILIRKIKESKEINISDIKRLLSIVTVGEFLPALQVEWADAFKADFSNELIDLILTLLNQNETEFDDSICIGMANALFLHDPLNEDALKLKCSILVKMGKNGLAKNTYTTFVKEYQTLFGIEYKYTFDQIIG